MFPVKQTTGIIVMAASFHHAPTGRWLTYCSDWKQGDVVTLSGWSQSKTQFYADGKTPAWCEFTQYTLAAPVAFDEQSGRPLFDLKECNPVCLLDVNHLKQTA